MNQCLVHSSMFLCTFLYTVVYFVVNNEKRAPIKFLVKGKKSMICIILPIFECNNNKANMGLIKKYNNHCI